jgi:hypothetical protein
MIFPRPATRCTRGPRFVFIMPRHAPLRLIKVKRRRETRGGKKNRIDASTGRAPGARIPGGSAGAVFGADRTKSQARAEPGARAWRRKPARRVHAGDRTIRYKTA